MLYYHRIDIRAGVDVLLKVITVKNVWFSTIGFTNMGLNIKVLFVMVVMIC